jgi:apolipoprotein N-acyltransferase
MPGGTRGKRESTLAGLLFGFIFWFASLVWIPVVVAPHFSWAYPGFLLLLLLLGGLSALFGWMTHHLHREKGVPFWLALALAWACVEWIKGHFPLGLSFPWLGLGVTLTKWPHLLGIAEWVGEGGVAFWLAMTNALAAEAFLALKRRTALAPVTGLALVALIPAGAGMVRARLLPLDPGPDVVVVGTQVPKELRGSPELAGPEAWAQVEAALEGVDPRTLDLLVLPEGTVPIPLEDPEAAGLREGLRETGSRLQVPLLTGGLGRIRSGPEAGGVANSVFLFPKAGSGPQRYDKVRLVPGMEAGVYHRESDVSVFQAGPWVVGPLLCYESLFGGLARDRKNAGADLLVNLSSDIWFGEEGSVPGSLFLHQHPAHLVLRAVETRMPVARAANGGYSLFLDPRGYTVSDVVPATGGSSRARLPVYRGRTLFSRSGDWVGPGAGAVCLFLLLLGALRKRTFLLQ